MTDELEVPRFRRLPPKVPQKAVEIRFLIQASFPPSPCVLLLLLLLLLFHPKYSLGEDTWFREINHRSLLALALQ